MPEPRQRIVFLGDSITDGHTYPYLVAESLAAAGLPKPVAINAGISGNTAAQMLARLDTDVLAHQPDLVVFNAGANDANHNVSPEEFAVTMAAIATQLDEAKIPLVILTTSVNLTGKEEPTARVDAYAALMRTYAAEHGHALGDVHAMLAAATAAGTTIMETDGIHPNYAGQQVMAAAVLTALGHPDIPVVPMTYALYPGTVRQWLVTHTDEPLTAADVAALQPDDTWTTLNLPQTEPVDSWWRDGERKRGYANLTLAHGKQKRYVALTTVTSDSERAVVLNLGGIITRLWLNGELLFDDASWRGWHAGRDRLDATLHPGDNTIVVEVGNDLFLSITPDRLWEDD